MTPTRPVLRWHGGKWILAPWIIRQFPPHRVYTEVFGGAASVLMRKPRAYSEVYNDLDGDVVNLFRVLRDKEAASNLRHLLMLTPFSREDFNDAYREATEGIERARRLVARSFMGFGSGAHNAEKSTGFRANSNRSGTTPAHDWAHYPDCMDAMVERLRGVVIENRPAVEVLCQHDGPETLHYVDPPYPAAVRDGGTDYRFEMSDDDHRYLGKVLSEMDGMVVVSGYPCALYDDVIFRGWHRIERKALADGARERTEVLWINEKAWKTSDRLL